MWHLGLDPDAVTDGSIKMATFSEGATAEALTPAGRRCTPTIVLHYTHNSVNFQRGVAA